MRQTAGRSLWACLTAMFIFLPAGLVVVPAFTMTAQQQAKVWAKELSALQISQLPERLNDLPLEYQKMAYNVLSPSQKVELWRSRLAAYAASRRDLSEPQREMIDDAIAFATVQRFERPAAFREKNDAMMKRAMATFGNKAAFELFTYPWERSATTAPTLVDTVRNYVRANFIAEAGQPDCYCYYNVWCQTFYPPGYDVCDWNAWCRWASGCGFFGDTTCFGMCAG
jgi:hypothetical protein